MRGDVTRGVVPDVEPGSRLTEASRQGAPHDLVVTIAETTPGERLVLVFSERSDDLNETTIGRQLGVIVTT